MKCGVPVQPTIVILNFGTEDIVSHDYGRSHILYRLYYCIRRKSRSQSQKRGCPAEAKSDACLPGIMVLICHSTKYRFTTSVLVSLKMIEVQSSDTTESSPTNLSYWSRCIFQSHTRQALRDCFADRVSSSRPGLAFYIPVHKDPQIAISRADCKMSGS